MRVDFLINTRDKVTEIHRAIKRIRDVRNQMQTLLGRLKGNDDYQEVTERGNELIQQLTSIEEALYQTKNESAQDPLNFPIRLNNRLSALIGVAATGDFRPTAQTIEVRDMLVAEIDQHLQQLNELMTDEVAQFNQLVHEKDVPAISVDGDK